jgi:hypothetical protein
MDLGSAIFGIFSLACFIVPVIYLQNVKKKEKKKFLQNFLQLAGQQQLTISQYDCWSHYYGIGIDSSKNKLFYLKKDKETEQKIIIDLSEVEKCFLINKNRNIQGSKVIDQLGLGFSFLHSRLPEKTLVFYNKEESMTVNDELQLSEKWKAIVNANLQVPRRSATKGDKNNESLALA